MTTPKTGKRRPARTHRGPAAPVRRRQEPARPRDAAGAAALKRKRQAAAPGGKGALVTGAKLTFRPRRPEDDAFIVALTEEQLGRAHQEATGEPFPRAQFERLIQSGMPTVVVEQGEKRIGYYTYLVGADGIMHIHALVLEKGRRKEWGEKVMQHLEEEARRLGAHTLQVLVLARQPQSVAFTKELGFVEAYRMPPHTICFQKAVSPPASGQPQAGVETPAARPASGLASRP